MLIEVSKTKATKLIINHICEELSTEEFYELLVRLLKLYKKFEGAHIEDFNFLLTKKND